MKKYKVSLLNGSIEYVEADSYDYVHATYPFDNCVQFYRGRFVYAQKFDVECVEQVAF